MTPTSKQPNYKLQIKFDADYSKDMIGRTESEQTTSSLFGIRQIKYTNDEAHYYPPIIRVFAVPDKHIIMEFEPVKISVGRFGDMPELVEPKKVAHRFDIKCVVLDNDKLYKKVPINKTSDGFGWRTSVRGYKYVDDFEEIDKQITAAVKKLEDELDTKLELEINK